MQSHSQRGSSTLCALGLKDTAAPSVWNAVLFKSIRYPIFIRNVSAELAICTRAVCRWYRLIHCHALGAGEGSDAGVLKVEANKN